MTSLSSDSPQERELSGSLVRLRPAARSDVPDLVRIRRAPEVFEYWRGGEDLVAAIETDFAEGGLEAYVVVRREASAGKSVVGWIQWSAEEEPDYRFASIDIYLAPDVHGRGFGADAIRTLIRYLIDVHGHRRFEIDPATANEAAIRCYTNVGFRAVGVRRQSERGNDGTWHDALLMDLLTEEFEG